MTDMHGEPLDFGCGRTLARNAGIIASNGHLHEAVYSRHFDREEASCRDIGTHRAAR